MTKYTDKADAATQKLDARFIKAEKKVTSFGQSPSNDNVPSEKLVKDSLDAKADSSDIPTNVSELTNDAGYLTSHQDISGKADKTNGASQITDANANQYTNIGSLLSGASIQDIFAALNTKIGHIESLGGIVFTSNKGTASADKMGILYVENNNGDVDSYFVVEDNGSYDWEDFEQSILNEVSISWNDVTNKPSTFTPESHTHGNLTNDGKVGSTSGVPLITGTDGVVQAGSFGTTAGTFAEGNHTHDNTTEIEAYWDAFINAL